MQGTAAVRFVYWNFMKFSVESVFAVCQAIGPGCCNDAAVVRVGVARLAGHDQIPALVMKDPKRSSLTTDYGSIMSETEFVFAQRDIQTTAMPKAPSETTARVVQSTSAMAGSTCSLAIPREALM